MLESSLRESIAFRANNSHVEHDSAVHVGLDLCPGNRFVCPFDDEREESNT
jgi:hypothetical protein